MGETVGDVVAAAPEFPEREQEPHAAVYGQPVHADMQIGLDEKSTANMD